MNPQAERLRAEYQSRINKVLDYIDANLDNELKLRTLAEVACFSSYHFHRIFSAFMNESLNKYIQRIRLEKAATMLHTHHDRPITDIAYDCGFSTPSTFSRAFKEQFDMSASDWREINNPDSKIRQMKSNREKINSIIRKASLLPKYDIAVEYSSNYVETKWSLKMQNSDLKANVKVQKLDKMTVAYVRNVGPYQGNAELFAELFGKLYKWAGPRGLIRFPETKSISMYHDNPDLTDDDKLRISVCITVPEDTEVSGEVGKMEIPEGDYAIARFEILPHQYGEAWQAVYGGWLPESGYQCEDKPCFEMYWNNPEEHPEGKHIVDICVPVKPM